MVDRFVGLDLGQVRDFTAIAVVEREEPSYRVDWLTQIRGGADLRATYSVRYLERLALGTKYPAVVEYVRRLLRRPELAGRCTLVVDGTGVGRPVVDLLRETDLACEVIPVVITGGGSARRDRDGWHVPKRDLIAGVQVLLQDGRLRLAAGLPKTRVLIEEFASMQMRVTANGSDQYGAWREGAHDDLALAVAMGCWRAVREEVGVGERGERLL